MARYRCNRNPDGVRVGQTWYAKSPIGSPKDVIEISAIFGADYIYIKTKAGQELQTNEKYLKKIYSLKNHNDLFGET